MIVIKWNEWGFRPPLCTYRLHWARRSSWGWWDEWDDTALQTQASKFEPWRSEAEHATSRSLRLPIILNIYEWVGKTFFFFETWRPCGVRARDLWLSKQAALTTAPGSTLNQRWLNLTQARSNVGLMLGQRCRQRPSIKSTLFSVLFSWMSQWFRVCVTYKPNHSL